jgi:hypothetical protein
MAHRAHDPQSLPVANYSPALARALAWLGDRYLLASPINASSKRRLPAAASVPSFQMLDRAERHGQ